MKFLLLLYDDESAVAAMAPSDRRAIVDEHLAFVEMLRQRGALVVSEALSGEVVTLRFDAEAPMVTDGPFIDAKESIGGIYVIECADREAAIELASSLPRSPGLVAELRRIADV